MNATTKTSDNSNAVPQYGRIVLSIAIGVTAVLIAAIIFWFNPLSPINLAAGVAVILAAAAWEEKIAAWAYLDRADVKKIPLCPYKI